MFVGYQHVADHSATTQSALVPTTLERAGDLSQSRDGRGRPVQVFDPDTGLPFPGATIPSARLSPEAQALLQLLSDAERGWRRPLQLPDSRVGDDASGQHAVAFHSSVQRPQSAIRQPLVSADHGRYRQRVRVHRFEPHSRLSMPPPIGRTASRSSFSLRGALPVHAGRHRHDPVLCESYATCRATRGLPATIRNRSTGDRRIWCSRAVSLDLASRSSRRTPSRHTRGPRKACALRAVTTSRSAASIRPQQVDVLSQQDARGTFGFTGAATGSDLADFLLGMPRTSSIAFGNADKFLRGSGADAYVNDDWRVTPTLTVNAGVRWEYESPFTEAQGRLVNLDVAPNFTAASAVTCRRADRRCHRPPVSGLAHPAGHARVSAATWGRVASGRRLVARRARRLWHLPQHQRLPDARPADGAAAAVVEDVQRRELRGRNR